MTEHNLPMKQYTFTIFLEEVNGSHLAYAVEAGMVAADPDMETAVFKLGKMLVRHIQFADKNNRSDQIFHQPVPDIWQKFLRLKSEGVVEFRGDSSRIIGNDHERVKVSQQLYAAYC